jgi:hypothetical protein
MKVEFLRGIGDIRFLSSATRILANNLMRDDRIDVRFNPASLTADAETVRYIIDNIKGKDIDPLIKASTELWFIPARLILTTTKFINRIIQNIQYDTVLYSAHVGVYDYHPIKILLESGFRVVMGGPTAMIANNDVVRSRLKMIGCTDEMLTNLIIVSGYVDLKTDLYSIINEWKDTTIESNDFSTIWDCDDDPFQKYFKVLQTTMKDYPGGGFHSNGMLNVVVFRNFCHWGRCKFCHYPFMPQNNYIDDTSPEKIAQNIINTCKLYGTNNVFISDGCFIFNDQIEKICDILIKNKIYIAVLIRIPFLKNKEVINKINKYVSMLDIGIESFNDFTLKHINKGYKQEDIFKAFDMLSKHLNKDIRINPYLIMDLPYESRDDVIENYTMAVELQLEMTHKGFQFEYTPNLLEITWDTQHSLIDGQYIRRAEESQGRHIAFEFIRNLGLIEDFPYYAIPFQRHDKMGNILESDLYQIPESYTDMFCCKYGMWG